MFKLQRVGNAVLEPIKENAWESQAVFNPAAIREGEHVLMIYRAVEGDNYSTLGYAKLDRSGKILERWPEPHTRNVALKTRALQNSTVVTIWFMSRTTA
ncbi:hypothetical protein HUU39_22805 [candidate division KSB1 bacterium]|nr:hypothetical protein [candidate division KSB1 bacterium]